MKVKFIKLKPWVDRDLHLGEYRVTSNGSVVGYLRVERNGFKQYDLKRGTPSQWWEFVTSEGQSIYGAHYLKEIKQKALELHS